MTAVRPEAVVAATDLQPPRPLRARRRAGCELPWLAAGLGALAAREARGQSLIDARFLFYKEGGGRTQVINPLVLLHQDLGSAGAFDLNLGFDSITGASPSGNYPTADVTTSASGNTSAAGSVPLTSYHDQRKAVGLAYGRKFGAHLPSIDVSYAKENDYTARGFGLSDSWTLASGRGTLHYAASISRDIVAPVTNTLELAKHTDSFGLGWSWILSERDLVDVSGSLMKLSGYLDDPYKVVPIGLPGTATTLPDHRPDSRTRWAVLGRYGHYYPWDGALKATYRYYQDDWSVRAHTLEVVYDQRIDDGWILSPQVRFYTQTAASFYGSLLAQPREFRSADYRLSPFSSFLGGVSVSKKLDDRRGVSLGVTLESQQGRDRITPVAAGGMSSPSISAADLTIVTVTLGYTFGY